MNNPRKIQISTKDNANTENVYKNFSERVNIVAIIVFGGSRDNRFMFSTISNVINLLGVHEKKVHGDVHIKRKIIEYDMQMKDLSWKTTTLQFKIEGNNNKNQY